MPHIRTYAENIAEMTPPAEPIVYTDVCPCSKVWDCPGVQYATASPKRLDIIKMKQMAVQIDLIANR